MGFFYFIFYLSKSFLKVFVDDVSLCWGRFILICFDFNYTWLVFVFFLYTSTWKFVEEFFFVSVIYTLGWIKSFYLNYSANLFFFVLTWMEIPYKRWQHYIFWVLSFLIWQQCFIKSHSKMLSIIKKACWFARNRSRDTSKDSNIKYQRNFFFK